MVIESSYYLKFAFLPPGPIEDQLPPDRLAAGLREEQIRDTDLSSLPQDQQIRLETDRRLGHLLVRLQGIQDWIGDQVDNPGTVLFASDSLRLDISSRSLINSSPGEEISFPVTLPFLETAAAFIGHQLGILCSDNVISNDFALRVDLASHFLSLLDFVKHRQDKQNKRIHPVWETTTDGYHCYAFYSSDPSSQKSAYYKPGIDSFGLSEFIRSTGPLVPMIRTQFRMEICDNSDPDKSQVVMDFSLQKHYSKAGDKGNSELIEVVDQRYGPNRHHVLLATGPREECVRFIHETMKAFSCGQLIVSTADIPRSSPTCRR